ncbi:MAG TPA: F0F1 ATP synthase subunit delta [Burkholderiaceae bacterium]|nr:F0F1 ATP synthase subunit delta [Burkholderiaceae bacterium]HQR71781.1 F0F1 ATP synthase subunit delta [Burkholderiaceae bacterium]
MAELSTVARPYAEALFSVAKASGQSLDAWQSAADELAALMAHPQVAEVVADPNLDHAQVFGLLSGMMKAPLPEAGGNFLKLLIENQRLAVLPEVAMQFRRLKNDAEGVADCLIETAFPLNDAQVADLLGALVSKFGRKLKPEVRVNSQLIGGVRATVGDQVLDGSVRARLTDMQTALTA